MEMTQEEIKQWQAWNKERAEEILTLSENITIAGKNTKDAVSRGDPNAMQIHAEFLQLIKDLQDLRIYIHSMHKLQKEGLSLMLAKLTYSDGEQL